MESRCFPGHPLNLTTLGFFATVSMPFYAASTLLSIAELPVQAARAVPRAFYFWLLVSAIVTLWRIGRLWAARRAMAASVMEGP